MAEGRKERKRLKMKITWIGHSCFKVEKENCSVILDPYEDGSVPGLLPVRERANMVLCSHGHGDHNARQCVTEEKAEIFPFTIETVETFHDDVKGAKRGTNIIHIIADDGMRIGHFGDLGCRLEPEQTERLKGLDAAMIPVGGFYTIDARQAAELVKQLNPRIVIPMHYRSDEKGFGFKAITTVEEFTALMADVVVKTDSELDLDAAGDVCGKTVVLQPQNAEYTAGH